MGKIRIGVIPVIKGVYDASKTYSLMQRVYDKEGGDMYESLCDDNTGNALTDTTKWAIVTVDGTYSKANAAVTTIDGYIDVIKKPIVSTSDASVAMDANKFYVITVGTALTLTMNAATDMTITNDWEGCFDTGKTAPTVTWPNGVNWGTSYMTLAVNTHYEFSIRLEGGKYYGILYGWALS